MSKENSLHSKLYEEFSFSLLEQTKEDEYCINFLQLKIFMVKGKLDSFYLTKQLSYKLYLSKRNKFETFLLPCTIISFFYSNKFWASLAAGLLSK
jgi:hypothetical protein